MGKICLKASFQSKTTKVRKLPWESIITKCFKLIDLIRFFFGTIPSPFSELSWLTCDCTFWQTKYLSGKFRRRRSRCRCWWVLTRAAPTDSPPAPTSRLSPHAAGRPATPCRAHRKAGISGFHKGIWRILSSEI